MGKIRNMIMVLSLSVVTAGPLQAQAKNTGLIAKQVELINQGLANGGITNETREFFLQSLREMQGERSNPRTDAVAEFTRIVYEGIASGEITEETRDFFLQAVEEFNRNR